MTDSSGFSPKKEFRKGIFNDFPTALLFVKAMVTFIIAVFVFIIPVLSDKPYLDALVETFRDNGVRILISVGVLALVAGISYVTSKQYKNKDS